MLKWKERVARGLTFFEDVVATKYDKGAVKNDLKSMTYLTLWTTMVVKVHFYRFLRLCAL